ncbi:MAG: hypothetical protein H0V29_12880 [Thermoleophilaceae bacterium]|nr:hypothetical protein [Thermoleophilaceae bacterium]
MALPRVLLVVFLAALAPLALSGCELGKKGADHEEIREGIDAEVDGVAYNIYITRQLNIRQPPDEDFYQGPEPPPGFVYYGVFLKTCNITDENQMPIERFIIEDTQGNEYFNRRLPEANTFGYHAKELAPQECIPLPGSAGDFNPTGGAMLLFELPVQAQQDRPLELQLQGTYDLLKKERTEKTIELDI